MQYAFMGTILSLVLNVHLRFRPTFIFDNHQVAAFDKEPLQNGVQLCQQMEVYQIYHRRKLEGCRHCKGFFFFIMMSHCEQV